MTRQAGSLRTGETTILRAIAGDIAADNATLSDANYPVSAAIDCAGFDSLFVGLEIATPGTATAVIEVLFYDEGAGADKKWSRILLGAEPGVTLGALGSEVTPSLSSGTQYAELRVFGQKVFVRVVSVANPGGTGSMNVLGRPGRVRGDRPVNLRSVAAGS